MATIGISKIGSAHIGLVAIEKLRIKNRENENKIGNQKGVVVSTAPLKISILEGAVMLDDELHCPNHLLAHSIKCKINGMITGGTNHEIISPEVPFK